MNEYMQQALLEARKAFDKGEIPIGAVIVKNGKIIGRGHNLTETGKDPTAHAEIIAIKHASKAINDWRLNDCEIYVTLEPCPMCAYAILRSRINKIFFGAYDPEYGACGSKINIPLIFKNGNKMIQISGGIMKQESSSILKDFFEEKRK